MEHFAGMFESGKSTGRIVNCLLFFIIRCLLLENRKKSGLCLGFAFEGWPDGVCDGEGVNDGGCVNQVVFTNLVFLLMLYISSVSTYISDTETSICLPIRSLQFLR